MCEVVLNSHMKHQTAPAEPNQGLHQQIIMCTQKREQSMTKVN